MNRYLVIAFAFMGVWFYEASGGADFKAGENRLVVFATPKPVQPYAPPRVERVARADTGEALTSVPASIAVAQPSANAPTDGLALARVAPNPATPPIIEPVVVEEAVEVVAPEQPEVAATAEADPDYRFVDADRVNLRGGPGTDFAVVGRLLRNDMVQVLKDSGEGWLQLVVPATGEEGWIADWLVSAAN